MGISLGLGTLLAGVVGAGASAASAHHTQAANAAAQSELNEATMRFNEKEASKARDWQAAQAVLDRQFNSAEALKQRQFSSEEAATARSFDAQQSLLARQFEERMSSSAHQREVADLRAAGLNPVLSVTGGSGASTPVAPVIGASAPSGVAASHSGSGGAQASIGGLNAYMKKDVIGEFVNSALESMRVHNDFIKAKAQDKDADAQVKNAQTNALREAQDAIESAARITKLDADANLSALKGITEKQLAEKLFEETLKVIQEKADNHEVAMATRDKLRSDASSFAAMCFSQAKLNDIRGELESAESPAKIRSLNSQADHLEAKIKEIKFDLTDPRTLAYRNLWSKNPEGMASGEFVVDQFGKIINVNFGISSSRSYGEHHGTIRRSRD